MIMKFEMDNEQQEAMKEVSSGRKVLMGPAALMELTYRWRQGTGNA